MNSTEMIQKIYSLSPMQEGMLLYTLMDQDKHKRTYFEQKVFKINGKLDINAYEESINKIIERYDILRTIFVNTNIPVQIVLKENKINIYFEDISHLTKDEKIELINDFKEKDIEKGFDLSKKVPIKFSVLKTQEEEYIFIQSFHHILLDGWSSPILFNEIIETYYSLKNNVELKLPKVNEYSKYIKWLEKQNKEEAISYWERYLGGYEQQACIPKLSNVIDESKYINKSVELVIDKEITNKLKNIAKNNNVTVNTIFQTVWGILLQRYNNVDDVVFGAVVSGRPAEIDGIENMVGLFINTVPVRIKSDSKKSFIE